MGDGEQALLEVVAELSRPARRLRGRRRGAAARARRRRWGAAVVGSLAALDADGTVRVDFPGNPAGEPVAARTAVALVPEDVGCGVVLLFEGADPSRPLVMGKLLPAGPRQTVGVASDGRRLTLSAEKEIVLSCGEASITLTRAGKVLVRGNYVLTQANGVNRIRGGTVQIN